MQKALYRFFVFLFFCEAVWFSFYIDLFLGFLSITLVATLMMNRAGWGR